jgi:hypothetical protein
LFGRNNSRRFVPSHGQIVGAFFCVAAFHPLPGVFAEADSPVVVMSDAGISHAWISNRILEITLDASSLLLEKLEGGRVLLADSRASGIGNSGEPRVPVYLLVIQHPPGDQVSVTWTNQGDIRKADGMLEPVLTRYQAADAEDGAGVAVHSVPDPAIYDAPGPWPTSPLSAHFARQGDSSYARFGVCPVAFFPEDRRLTLYQKLVVRVLFKSSDE